MKKILFLFALVVGMLTTQAQNSTVINGNLVDTLQTGGDTVTYTISTTAGYSAIGIQPVVTKVSGTVAGSVILYGSLDGINYVSLGDTMSLTDVATNTTLWAKVTTPYTRYRLVFISSGTQVSIPRVYYVLRRHN